MDSVGRSLVEVVFEEIKSGTLFEKLANELMSAIQGTSFVPVGGIHDKGIDGLEYVCEKDSDLRRKKIYQFSIRHDPKQKIRETIKTLKSNEIEFSQLIYGTNRVVKNQHEIIDDIVSAEDVFLQICDLNWFATNINHNPRAIEVFNRFVEENIHFDNRPVRGFELFNVRDPRIYVYLRQIVDRSDENRKLDEILIDTLIIMALEGTDSTKRLFMSKSEVLREIQAIRGFDQEWLRKTVSDRLEFFATKPRQVRHHRREEVYCLPYETRCDLEICRRNDEKLYEGFMNESLSMLETELCESDVDMCVARKLFEKTFHEIFHQQGLEFSEFLANRNGATSLDKSLQDIVNKLIEDSNVNATSVNRLEQALLKTVRDIVYHGSTTQLEFLRRLSSTYRMLFLMQCDPKLASFFEEMSKKLVIYVDTSILIPAFSEYFLKKRNQRHANLLRCARDAGIALKVTNIVLTELAAHFHGLKRTFGNEYENYEHLFRDSWKIQFIDDMLIRAYFHANHAGKIDDFRSYYETFVTWNSSNAVGELIEWVRAEFDIEYEDISNQELRIDPDEADELFRRLRKYKPTDEQTQSDVSQLLHIYAIREKNNELGKGGAFGYNTWWLTSDTSSQRAFSDMDKSHTRNNPYIRADFLYNFIDLAPSKRAVKRIYEKVFPTLLGVNISYFVPEQIRKSFLKYLHEQRNLADTPAYIGRLKAMSEEIKQRRYVR